MCRCVCVFVGACVHRQGTTDDVGGRRVGWGAGGP